MEMISRETLIYRYLSFEKFLDLLESQSLYMAQLTQFADRWELSPPKFLESVEFWKSRISRNQHYSKYTAFHDCWAERIRTEFLADYFGNIGSFRASCWTMAGPDDEALWSIYGNRNTGIVVGSIVQSIFDCTDPPQPSWEAGMCISPVMYVDYEKLDIEHALSNGFTHSSDLSEFVLSQIGSMYKKKALSFEQEIRILTYGCSERLSLNDFSFIKEIIVAPNASNFFLDLVREICEKKSVKASIRPSSLRPPQPIKLDAVKHFDFRASVYEHPADSVIIFDTSESFFDWYNHICIWSGIPQFSGMSFGIPTYTEAITLFHYGFVQNLETKVVGVLSSEVFARGYNTVRYQPSEWMELDPSVFNDHLCKIKGERT